MKPDIDIHKDKTVDSFEELSRLVQPFRKDGKWIFRGVRQSTYQLLPKIGRWGTRKGVGSPDDLPYDPAGEETMTRHFMRSAGPYVKHIPATRLEWLALAQHHGMFTRLLDWTESLLVAAYFAVEDARNRASPPMIYCVRDIPVAPAIKHDKPRELDEVMLYYPPHMSPRIPAQSSVFTVHKYPDRPFMPNKVVRVDLRRLFRAIHSWKTARLVKG